MKIIHNIHHQNQGCISQDQLLKYLKGGLSGREMNRVEKHLAVCPMCADELEGLELLNDPNEISGITKELNKQVDKKLLGPHARIVTLRTWSRIAASLLILFALSTLIYIGSLRLKPSLSLSENIPVEKSEDSVPDKLQGVAELEVIPEEIAEVKTPTKEPTEEKKKVKSTGEDVIIVDEKVLIADETVIADADASKADTDAINNEKIAEATPKPASGADVSPAVSHPAQLNNTSEQLMGSAAARESKLRMASTGAITIDTQKLKPTIKPETIAANIVTEEELEEEAVFAIVEQMPRFTDENGDDFETYIMKNRRYPVQAIENAIQGKVYVEFCVEEDGTVTNVKVVKGVDPLLDREALRIIESSPKWKPGMQRGQPVKVRMNVPVIFELF